jgi:hypothetical protein
VASFGRRSLRHRSPPSCSPDNAAEILPALTKNLVTHQLGFDRVPTQLGSFEFELGLGNGMVRPCGAW